MNIEASKAKGVRRPGLLGAFRKADDGAINVEFAILAAPFFLLLLVLLETAIVLAGEVMLERAVEQVGRQVRTGQLDQADMNAQTFADRVCAQVDIMMDCEKLKIDLATYEDYADIQIQPPVKDGANDYSGFGYTRGGPQEITTLRVFYEWPLQLDIMRKTLANQNGDFVMLGMAAFRSEAYR